MIMNILQRQLKPEMVDEAVAFFKGSASPSTHEACGIDKQMMGLDRNTNQLVMVTIWKSKEAYKAMISSSQFQRFIAPLERYFAPPTEIHDYEVVYDI